MRSTDSSQTGRRRPIRVPVTTIFSRRDGIVDWRSSIDDSLDAVNIEVANSHLGLGLDADVWRIIADRIDTHSDCALNGSAVRKVPHDAR